MGFSDIKWVELLTIIAVTGGAIGAILAPIYMRKTWRSQEAMRKQDEKHFLLQRRETTFIF